VKNKAPKATKREKARTKLILSLTCIYCTLSGDFRSRKLENHHIVRGNKRLGHWYTLQVCAGHHRGEYTDQPIRVGIHSGRHALKDAYGYDELELWQRQQVALHLDDELPATKVLPRREHGMAHRSVALVAPLVSLPPGLPVQRKELCAEHPGAAGIEATQGDTP